MAKKSAADVIKATAPPPLPPIPDLALPPAPPLPVGNSDPQPAPTEGQKAIMAALTEQAAENAARAALYVPPPAPTPPPALPASTAPQIEYIEATYRGQYFVPAETGNATKPFEITVKVPAKWLHDEDESPLSTFHKHYKNIVKKDLPGFTGFHTVEFVHATPRPPLQLGQEIAWSASLEDLQQISQRLRLPVDLSLYPTATELKNAIRACREDVEAFKAWQKKRNESGKVQRRVAAEEDLKALGY